MVVLRMCDTINILLVVLESLGVLHKPSIHVFCVLVRITLWKLFLADVHCHFFSFLSFSFLSLSNLFYSLAQRVRIVPCMHTATLRRLQS